MHPNPPPTVDGDVNHYINDEAFASPWFDHGARTVFINGMGNAPPDHKESALAISLLQMSQVTGVYNQKASPLGDLVQCLGDKFQFDGPLARSPSEALDRIVAKMEQSGHPTTRAKAMELALARNPAALSLFQILRMPIYRWSPIFAHSQGNLILSNVLSAIEAVDGERAIVAREVHSFGSPTVNWPTGLKHQQYAFTFDPVSWLAGFDTSFQISKLGVHTYEGSRTLISHGFKVYAENDPAFVINRFRWGSFGATFNMDEDGLADALVAMKANLIRVHKIFEYLDKKHNSDVDDVAVLYVKKLRQSVFSHMVLAALKQHMPLRSLLIRVMEEGWTGSDERAAINYLKTV